MGLIAQLAFNAIYGFLAHQLKPIIDQNFYSGWRDLINYVIGVLLVYPAFIMTRDCINDPNHKSSLSYILSFLSFGFGVALGWFWDTVTNK